MKKFYNLRARLLGYIYLGAQKNRPIEKVLLSTRNICFG